MGIGRVLLRPSGYGGSSEALCGGGEPQVSAKFRPSSKRIIAVNPKGCSIGLDTKQKISQLMWGLLFMQNYVQKKAFP